MECLLHTFNKHRSQRSKLILSAVVEEASSSESAKDWDVSEEFSRLLKLLDDLNLKVVQKGIENAKTMINIIKSKMIELFQNISTSTNAKIDDIIILATIYFQMGALFIDYAKNLLVGEIYFTKCLELLKGKECERKTITTTMRVLIELSSISSKLQKPEKHYFFLNQAMMLYLKYTNEENEYPDPIDTIIVFEEEHPKLLLEALHAVVVESLIEIYQNTPKNLHRFVTYFHNLLEKQMAEIITSRNEESMMWTNASLALAMYFIQNDRFTEARNHIAAAEYIMDTFCDGIQENNFAESLRYLYKKIRVHIAQCWGMYGLRLLYISRRGLFQDKEDDILHEVDNSESEFRTKPEEELTKFLIFADLEKDLEEKYLTNQITDKYLLNFNDAKIVFVNVLRWWNDTKKYYSNTDDLDPIEFVNLILQISFAYKYFVKYEQDKDKKVNLYKMQIKTLKEALQVLNTSRPKILNSNSGAIYYAQITCEIASANSLILSMKTEPLMLNIGRLTNDNSVDNILTEITELVSSNVDYLKSTLEAVSKIV